MVCLTLRRFAYHNISTKTEISIQAERFTGPFRSPEIRYCEVRSRRVRRMKKKLWNVYEFHSQPLQNNSDEVDNPTVKKSYVAEESVS